jgi:C-terminal processing protease CtpA/Prc
VAILVLTWLIWRPSDDNTARKVPQQTGKGYVAAEDYRQLLNRLDNLEDELFQLTSNRQQLEQRLSQLENSDSDSTAQAHTESTSATDQQPQRVNAESADIPIQQKLIDQGLAQETAQQLQKYVDDKRLQRLNLRDQAIREGWQDSDEYVEKMNALSDAAYGLKEEFGEEVYDQYLYASGRPNRVIVREVINGSVAQSAGLPPGAMIIRYANEPIYSMNELRQATTKGTSGETILLEFMRDDQPYSASIVRGPLGISMDFARVAP